MTDGVKEVVSRPVKRVPCEVYSRVVGYLRPVQDWNKGKQQEFAERRMYAVQEAALQSPAPVAQPGPVNNSKVAADRQDERKQPCPEGEP